MKHAKPRAADIFSPISRFFCLLWVRGSSSRMTVPLVHARINVSSSCRHLSTQCVYDAAAFGAGERCGVNLPTVSHETNLQSNLGRTVNICILTLAASHSCWMFPRFHIELRIIQSNTYN